MSRAFVKEQDGDQVPLERRHRHQSDAPNLITPRGEQALREQISELTARRSRLKDEEDRLGGKQDLMRLDDDLTYLKERLDRAIVIPQPDPPWHSVELGARVELIDQDDQIHLFTVVGEDEIDVPAGRISWNSPLGRAILHRSIGDVVQWKRPKGDLEVEIVAVSYDVDSPV